MQTRRALLAGLAAVGGLSLAGCLDELLDDEIVATAEPAEVADAVLDDAGYHHVETQSYTIDESLDVGGESIHLEGTSWVASYAISEVEVAGLTDDELDEHLGDLEVHELAGFGVVSTPSEEIVGVEVNPAARLEDEELVEEFADQIAEGDITDLERLDDGEVTILEETTDVAHFSGVVIDTTTDEEYDIYLYLAEVTHEDDIIIAVGAHHALLEEEAAMYDLMAGIDHPVDPP